MVYKKMSNLDYQEEADALYDIIYDFLEVNPISISILLLVFEQIKYEQMKEFIQDGE